MLSTFNHDVQSCIILQILKHKLQNQIQLIYTNHILLSDENILTKFLSLGVAASVGIIIGTLIVCIFCTISLVCCCRNSFCKKRPASGSSSVPPGAGLPMTNGGPGSHHGSHHGSVHSGHHGGHHGNGQTQIGRGMS